MPCIRSLFLRWNEKLECAAGSSNNDDKTEIGRWAGSRENMRDYWELGNLGTWELVGMSKPARAERGATRAIPAAGPCMMDQKGVVRRKRLFSASVRSVRVKAVGELGPREDALVKKHGPGQGGGWSWFIGRSAKPFPFWGLALQGRMA